MDSRFIARREQQLVIREKILSLSGDSFIKNKDGHIVFRVDGRVLSLSGRKHVRDDLGNQLFDIRKKLLTLRTAFFCEDLEGKRFFKVKRQFSMCKSLITHLRAIMLILEVTLVGSFKAI